MKMVIMKQIQNPLLNIVKVHTITAHKDIVQNPLVQNRYGVIIVEMI